jgi:general secretion pathway protein D
MSIESTNPHKHHLTSMRPGLLLLWTVLVVFSFTGCKTMLAHRGVDAIETNAYHTYVPTYLDFDQCKRFLDPLGLDNVAHTSSSHGSILLSRVKGTPDQLEKALKVLDVVDSLEAYCIENLGPASAVRAIPSNKQLEMTMDNLNIGSFDEPPFHDGRLRAIIDVHGDAILAFIPVRYRTRLHTLLAHSNIATYSPGISPDRGESMAYALNSTTPPGKIENGQQQKDSISLIPAHAQAGRVVALTEMAIPSDSTIENKTVENPSGETENPSTPPKTTKINFTLRPQDPPNTETNPVTTKAVPKNGDDLLDLTLPETMTVIQLLDLTGKHLGLNYVYDPRTINNQQIVLKLHGALQGELRVKNLYALLETTLDSMGLVMIRQAEDLVAVVTIDKALENQPELIEMGNNAVQIGDTIVTRVFDIQYVEVASVISLLESMKLSFSVAQVDKSNLLLVTCHADRMNRIEQLVAMIDRPGDSIECRFRRLCYVTATPLITKVRSLAEELEGISVAAASTAKPSMRPAKAATASKPGDPIGKRPVYLDTDERTNRILMIGAEEELDIIEQLVDTLDVIQEDLRTPRIYPVRYLDAQAALEKLQELEVLKAPSGKKPGADADKNGNDYVLTGEPLVAVLEATNQLLIKAAPAQHASVYEFLDYIDVTPEDTRTISAYEVQHIDVHEAKKILEELELVSTDTVTSSSVAGPNEPARRKLRQVPAPKTAESPAHASSVVVNESTNALLVKATADQHARIAKMISYIDTKRQEEEFSYHIYPLESSSPGHLASLLEKLILETTPDEEDKIVKKDKTTTRITIVPDPNTFSLIVHASQKNQKMIEGLINRLDRRRPQVLIDVTLVEITRADTFEYDLNLVANAKDAVVGNLVVDAISQSAVGTHLEGGFNLLDQNGNPTGQTKAFYSDKKVQALLTAIQQKNYGRILAKPKVLVNDGNKGQIIATDETTYVKESIQIPQAGTPITTRDFVSIQASIELEITPHISEGNLLRLDVHLSRDDFGTRPVSGAPPDKASSEVTTTVFVPDNNTVILGGLVKLNQSKGGSKVPILGDIPLIGGLFRSVDNSDIEKKLYVFLKANVVKPYDELRLMDLEKMSEVHKKAFEKSEAEFQQLQNMPGITPTPMQPERVLKDYR